MGESRRFSPGDKQQEATHLHFQRPAPSATLLPRKAIVRIYLGALRPRGLGEGPQNLPRPQPPTSASRGLGWRACPGRPDPGVGGFREGLTPKVGKKTDPALRARLTKGGWEPDLGAEARVCRWGSGPGLRRGRSTSKPRPAPWPFATGSRAGGGRKNTRGRAVGRGLVPAGHPPPPDCGAGSEPAALVVEASRPGASTQAAAWNAGGGLPSPRPRRLPPTSRLARSGRHRPSRGWRAKWRPSGRLAPRRRAREPRRATPPGPRPPKRPPPPAPGSERCAPWVLGTRPR